MDSNLRQLFLHTLDQDITLSETLHVYFPREQSWGPMYWAHERYFYYLSCPYNTNKPRQR